MYDLKWVMTSAATCLQRSERPYLTDRYRQEVFFILHRFCPSAFFNVWVILIFVSFLLSDHFLVISVCLFVALAHVSVCWVCFLSVWFTLGGLCNFFGQCILCLTSFFFCTFWEVSKYTGTESSRVRFIQKHVELYFICLLLNPMKLFHS